MKNNLLITIIAALILGIVGFFAGMQYQKSQNTQGNTLITQRQTGRGRFGSTKKFANITAGSIVTVDSNSIVIQLSDGSSKIINILPNTKVFATQTVSESSLTKGNRVAIVGTSNSDGSITAQNIQVNPFRMNSKPTN